MIHLFYLRYYKHVQAGGKPSTFRDPVVTQSFREVIASLKIQIALNQASYAQNKQCVGHIIGGVFSPKKPSEGAMCEKYLLLLTELEKSYERDLLANPSLGQLFRMAAVVNKIPRGVPPQDTRTWEHALSIVTMPNMQASTNPAVNVDLDSKWTNPLRPFVQIPTSKGGGLLDETLFNSTSYAPFAPLGLIPEVDRTSAGEGGDFAAFFSHDINHSTNGYISRSEGIGMSVGYPVEDSFRCSCQISERVLAAASPEEKRQVTALWFNWNHEVPTRTLGSVGRKDDLIGMAVPEVNRGCYRFPLACEAIRREAEKLTENCFSDEEGEKEYKAYKAKVTVRKADEDEEQKRISALCTNPGLSTFATYSYDMVSKMALRLRGTLSERFAALPLAEQERLVEKVQVAILASDAAHLKQARDEVKKIRVPRLVGLAGKALRGAGISAVVSNAARAAPAGYEESKEFFYTVEGIKRCGSGGVSRESCERNLKDHPGLSQFYVELSKEMGL